MVAVRASFLEATTCSLLENSGGALCWLRGEGVVQQSTEMWACHRMSPEGSKCLAVIPFNFNRSKTMLKGFLDPLGPLTSTLRNGVLGLLCQAQRSQHVLVRPTRD